MAVSNVPHSFYHRIDSNAIERWCQNAELSEEGVQTLRLRVGENAPAFFQTVRRYTDHAQSVTSRVLEGTQRNLPAHVYEARSLQQYINQISASIPLVRYAIGQFLNESTSLGVVDVIRFMLETARTCCHILNQVFALQDASLTDDQGEQSLMVGVESQGVSHTEARIEEYTDADTINPDVIFRRLLSCFTGK